MTTNGNRNKNEFLGMPFGTAQSRLRKMMLFDLLKRHNENICYRCGREIESIDELSLEHKKAWLNVSLELFWDLGNLAFSHLHCNSGERIARQRNLVHGTPTGYKYGCHCKECKEAHNKALRDFRTKRSSTVEQRSDIP